MEIRVLLLPHGFGDEVQVVRFGSSTFASGRLYGPFCNFNKWDNSIA